MEQVLYFGWKCTALFTVGTQDNVITARVTIEFSRNLCSIARSEGLCKSCSKEFITQIEEKLYGKDPPLKPHFQSYINVQLI